MFEHNPISLIEAYQCIDKIKPDDEALNVLLRELMSVSDTSRMAPAFLEHYRQAAAAAALLIAAKQADKTFSFDVKQIVAGTPPMPFRIAFVRRIAEAQGIDLGI